MSDDDISIQLEQHGHTMSQDDVSIQVVECGQDVDSTQSVMKQHEPEDRQPSVITDAAMRVETRPKRGSTVKYRLKGNDEVYEARVKHVGRKSSVKKNMCWLENEDSRRMEVVDFGKQVDAWDYLQKCKIGVQEDGKQVYLVDKELDCEKSKAKYPNEKGMEEYGVFLMKR
jgi:hypothetical protein